MVGADSYTIEWLYYYIINEIKTKKPQERALSFYTI